MDMLVKERFMQLWDKYFDGAGLPMVFYYTNDEKAATKVKVPSQHRCILADLSRVATGKNLLFDTSNIGCFGGKHYLGFTQEWMPNFEYFLSCGIPGQMEGERYKKTPDLVKDVMKVVPEFKAPAKYVVFKRWDKIDAAEDPEVVIFLAPPDVLSGLFTLANFDRPGLNGVFSPFGAGCSTVVLYPYKEKDSATPRGVIGMFDVSARPCVRPNLLSFSVPMNRFIAMMDNMDVSFLTTGSWAMVRKRIAVETKKNARI
jgi:uncharacterized protein (DUF169 family)